MIFIGVDPGKKGAIAYIAPDWVEWRRMPVITSTRPKSRDEYDVPKVAEYLSRFEGAFVTVERAQPLPPKMRSGSVAQFNRGVQRAGFEWMLTALKTPFQLVSPVVWMKVMHAGTSGADTKQRSILAAQRLFPGVDLRRTPRSRKLDDGVCEALLLAEYGRRTFGGAGA